MAGRLQGKIGDAENRHTEGGGCVDAKLLCALAAAGSFKWAEIRIPGVCWSIISITVQSTTNQKLGLRETDDQGKKRKV